jgi:glycosyltransferase involved in cell wall biosynthesis
VDPAKISVTHLGPKGWKFECDTASWEGLRQFYSIQEPYIAAFGGGALHKNITRLIEAYSSLKGKSQHQLVIIGRIPPDVDIEAAMGTWGLAGKLIVTGYVPEEHILPLLSHAELFVLPSLYEGFGLPVLEAQQAGVPIVCSSAAALPEVGGAGALYFDPTSMEDFINALHRGLTDESLRSQLIYRGNENLSRFSWEKTAQATLTIYKDVYKIFRNSSKSQPVLSY